MRPSTLSVHGGGPEPRVGEPVVLPIDRSVIHRLDESVYQARAGGDEEALVYARERNPTVHAVERRLAALEGAERSLLFASGQAALHALLLATTQPGQRVLAARSLYGGSTGLLRALTPRLDLTLEELDLDAPAELEATLARDGEVGLVFCESVANPLAQVTDLPRLVTSVRDAAPAARIAVDATLVSPLGQRALALGVDLVMHSATKVLGGHSDLMGGVVSGAAETMRAVWEWRTKTGGSPDPQAAWLLERGLKTLALRLARQSENALHVARFLESRPEVRAVHHPLLDSSPERERAGRLLQHAGGLFSFVLAGGDAAAEACVDSLRLFANAASLGSVESLASRPRGMSHVHLSEDECASLGLQPGLVRLSCGIEDADDLVADLSQSLARLAGR